MFSFGVESCKLYHSIDTHQRDRIPITKRDRSPRNYTKQ
jgi:hypothetical protein